MPSSRANALADRLEKGAAALVSLASSLTDSEWQTRLPKDGRKVSVVSFTTSPASTRSKFRWRRRWLAASRSRA